MTRTVSGPDYEAHIRAAAEAGEPAPDIAPPDDYDLSPDFQRWLVDQMRGHVMDQVAASGLDRTAIVKIERKDASDEGDVPVDDAGEGADGGA